MKILHSADLHLDSAFSGRGAEETAYLRQELLKIPGKLSALCREHGCDLMLLAGDLFDGAWTPESVHALKIALKEAAVPIFISPGNHDFCVAGSPWMSETWPENVHIFKKNVIESVSLPEIDCRIYGAAFTGMDCDALLENFQKEGEETYHIAVLHGDTLQKKSPYNPISQAQVASSGLSYLALGHVHKTGSFRVGQTLCAWPGCPMGRGYDELEEKGILLVELQQQADIAFIPLDGPRFYDLEAPILMDPVSALEAALPAVGNRDYYRITFTGECDALDLVQLATQFGQFPNLELRDHTSPVADPWISLGEDSLQGVYFGILHDALSSADEKEREIIQLAAKISRSILDGREVALP